MPRAKPMDLRTATVLCLLLGGSAGCAQPDALATPVLETCPPMPRGVDRFERAFPQGELFDLRLGACGELTWRAADGASYLGLDFRSDIAMADDARDLLVSAAGDQILSQREDGMAEWRATDAPDDVLAFEAERYGFVRDGAESVAWFCASGSLGTVGPSGVDVLAVPGSCDVWAAEAAPVLAHVDAEFELAVLNLRDGESTDMSEVPFVAASNDQVRLSRDGRMLFHQPRNTPVPRIAVFDVRRRAGDRLLGAPESNRNLNGMRYAPDAGHTVMFEGPDGFYVVTPNGFVNAYLDMTFVSLSPDGSEVLMVDHVLDREGSFDVLVSDLDSARIASLESAVPFGAHALPDRVIHSWDGNAVVTEGREPAFGQNSHRMSFRWDTREYRESGFPTGDTRARWISDTALVLTRDNDNTARIGRISQAPLQRIASDGFTVVNAPMADRVLLRLRVEDGERLVLASTESDASLDLGSYPGLRAVMTDHAGTRFATLTDETNASTPGAAMSRVVAQELPSLP